MNELWIYSKTGNPQGPLLNVSSIQWKSKYQESGTFEIHTGATEENMTILQLWGLVLKPFNSASGRWAEIGIIESIDYPKDSNEIEVKGHLDPLGCIVNLDTITIKDSSSIKKLVNGRDNGFMEILYSDFSVTATLENSFDTTYKTLRETVQSFCEASGLGYQVSFSNSEKRFYLNLYEGKKNETAWFTEKLENLLDQEYLVDVSGYANIAYIYGAEKEDGTRTSATINIRKDNEPKVELYVDARDISLTYTSEGEEKTYTNEEYEKLLLARGYEKLNEARKDCFQYTFDISTNSSSLKIFTDYVLGDIVRIKSDKFGFLIYARITEIEYTNEIGKGENYTLTIDILNEEEI